MKVCSALKEGDIEKARKAVSMIVGRDTAVLDRDGIARAAVETVAENTSDGVIAPFSLWRYLARQEDFSIKQSIPWIPWWDIKMKRTFVRKGGGKAG